VQKPKPSANHVLDQIQNYGADWVQT